MLAGRSPATEGDNWAVTPEANWGRLYRDGVGELRPPNADTGSFYSEFAAAVRGEADVPVNPWDAVAVLTVLDAARVSSQQGQVVNVDS